MPATAFLPLGVYGHTSNAGALIVGASTWLIERLFDSRRMVNIVHRQNSFLCARLLAGLGGGRGGFLNPPRGGGGPEPSQLNQSLPLFYGPLLRGQYLPGLQILPQYSLRLDAARLQTHFDSSCRL